MKKFRTAMGAFIGMSLLFSQLALSIEPSVVILGDVVGRGSTEMKTAFDKWISISDKAYPLMDGVHLRSGDGMMSSIFRDGARMEIGKNSEIIVRGARGNYSVDVGRGKIAFSLPQGISFSVTTPTCTVQTNIQPNIIRTVSTASQDYVRGSVGYDGRGTTVTAVSGSLMVKDVRGAAVHTLTAGNSIYITGAESGGRATPAQLAEVVRNDAGTNPKASSDDEDRRRRLTPFLVLGGFGLIEGGTYFYVNSKNSSKGGVASPSRP